MRVEKIYACYNVNMKEQFLTAHQVGLEFNIPNRNIRTLCNWGLVKGLRYNHVGRRMFSTQQAELVSMLYNLQKSGFSKEQLKQFVATKDKEERIALLRTQKRQLWQEISERQKSIDFIERQEEILADESKQHE